MTGHSNTLNDFGHCEAQHDMCGGVNASNGVNASGINAPAILDWLIVLVVCCVLYLRAVVSILSWASARHIAPSFE